jgi:hypothetical protein
MSYHQEYSQQPYAAGQGGGPAARSGGNPVTAVIAGIFGLVAAAALVVINIDFFGTMSDIGASLGDLPGELTTLIFIRFVAAALLLLGAVLLFARTMPGVVILALGGLSGVAAVLLYPVLLSSVADVEIGEYLEALFAFDTAQAAFGALALIMSPLALLFAILPPTLTFVRAPRSTDHGYPQQPQGYPQQPGDPQQRW